MKRLIDSNGQECSCCNEYKAYSEYGKHKRAPNGYRGMCRSCISMTRLLEKNGTVEKMGRVSKITPDDIMKTLNKRLYRKKLLELTKAFKEVIQSNSRQCRKCKNYKDNSEFECTGLFKRGASIYSKHCNDCRDGVTSIEYRKDNRRLRKQRIITDKILKLIKDSAESSIDNGFVYLYWSDELNCFKIGRTKYSPFVYIAGKSKEYGLDLKMVAFIICPIRDVDIERYVFRSIKSVRVEHIKPCGGGTRELFRCDLHDVLRIFKSITDSIYIEPNPFLNEDDIGGTTLTKAQLIEVCAKKRKKYNYIYKKRPPKESTIINKMFRDNKPKHLKEWNLFKWRHYQKVKCYAMGERDDSLFEAVYDKMGACISLGLYDNYIEAQCAAVEFKEFVNSREIFPRI